MPSDESKGTANDECSKEELSAEEQITRRKFLATTAAATGSLVLGTSGVMAQENKSMTSKSYDWAKLQTALKGDVVTASSPNWAEVLKAQVWNEIKPDRAPDCIVRVKNNDDVIAAVNFARENGLKIAIHGGGHTWCGLAVRNGGMTIDLTALNGHEIDAKNMKASLQPVLSNREVANLLSEQGLAFPTGHCPTVKMSGYLLNGGLSWNLSEWGPAVLSVESYDLVTADGKLVNANAKEHSDLYWAARGSGPGMFAVAVRYHLNLKPLPKAITTSNYWFSLDNLKEVVEKVADIGYNKLPAKVELSIFMNQAPADLQDKAKANNGWGCMVAAIAFADTPEEGKAALKPLEDDADLAKICLKKDVYGKTDFNTLSDVSGQSWPDGHRNLVENTFCNGNAADMYLALRDQVKKCPSLKTVIVFVHSTGKKKILEQHPDIACSAEGNYYGGTWSIWEHAKDDAANLEWQLETQKIMKKHISGYYIGETDYVAERGNVKQAYTTEKFKRLEEIRAKYDPTGVFQSFTGGLPKAKA